MKGREPVKLWGLGRNLWREMLRPLVVTQPLLKATSPERRAVWLEVREEDEEMAASRGLGKVLSKDGKGAGPTTEGWGMASASGRRTGLLRQEPTPPCPKPPRRDAGSGELKGLSLTPDL